jgi:hypothetical protein
MVWVGKKAKPVKVSKIAVELLAAIGGANVDA